MNLAKKITFRSIFFIAIALSISITLSGQVKSPVLNGKDRVAMFSKLTEMKEASPFKDMKWQYISLKSQ